MILNITIFFIAIFMAFGMLTFQVWRVRNNIVKPKTERIRLIPKVPFRQIEKILLYLTKNIIQWIVLFVVKYWLIITTKIRKFFTEKLPKLSIFFKRITRFLSIHENSFVKRSILESKAKIKRMKKVIKDKDEV